MNTCPYCNTPIIGTHVKCPSCGMPLNLTTLAKGTTLKFRYTIEKVLGQGGFGITYQAHDKLHNRGVALKEFFPQGVLRVGQDVIPSGAAALSEFLQHKQAFVQEAQTLAQFQHPSIVKVQDVFEENGTAYYAMELLDGESLGDMLRNQGTLPMPQVLTVAHAVSQALNPVHQAGMLHRDIKPDNIVQTKDQRTILIDFGSARKSTGQTQSMTQLVSPGYSPLEQYSSQGKYGPYTDLYALGATLYHCVQGSPPPSATDLVNGSLPAMSAHVPANLSRAIQACLKTSVKERPQTVQEFLGLLSDAPDFQENDLQLTEHDMHHSAVQQMVFLDPQTLITASLDHTVKRWTLSALDSPQKTFSEHDGGVQALVVFRDLLISGGDDGVVVIRPAHSVPYRIHCDEPVVSLGVMGNRLVVATRSRRLSLYDLQNRDKLLESQPIAHYINEMLILADQQKVVLGLKNGQVAFLNKTFQGQPLPAHSGPVCSILRGNQQVLTVGTEGSFMVWDITGNLMQTRYTHTCEVQMALFLNASTVVFADSDNTLWTLDTANQARSWLQLEQTVICMVLSPDGKQLLCGTEQGSVYLVDIQ
ncbi:protein kinase domain-containing protein [Deinococcus cellulosilyticus]|uniref:Protein kinase domain-containing protein n=1 Tax=Deinococcus cellulosilyticus (strain DSM 18568 / NBRC 106333 / KACC 11606 / 5516J-15) TaxID=1223518 RepID=A0A511N3J9_DEIC1|nr:protein kinase [Deinococcus cellulosilyticus]GEM46961.1 hypothetical protein DC3_25960 [Deinococcus cellulosilyticus NBRC 106333 = KACC 11606]